MKDDLIRREDVLEIIEGKYEILKRCCSFYSRTLCRGCPLFVKEMCRDSGVPTPANIAAIQKWAREHPERSEGCSK